MGGQTTRVVFVITDLELGGSPRWLRDLAVGLARHAATPAAAGRFECAVISLKALPAGFGGVIVEELRAAGITVRSLGISGPWHFIKAAPRLARMLRELRGDVVYSVLVHANVLTAAARIFLGGSAMKFVQAIHTLQERPRWHWWAEGLVSPFCDAVIVPAEAVLERMAAYGPFARGVVIPHGIDVARFAEATGDVAVPWPTGARVVGYVGRFDPVKNLPTLIRAVARMDETVHLALVGYGGEEPRLRRLVGSLGGEVGRRVHFIGPTARPEDWYKRFDCLALASTVEGFGLVLVEAMAGGTPVVAMDTAVIRGVVRDRVDGILLKPPPTPHRLAEALQRVMSRQGGPGGSGYGGGVSARWVAERFSVSRMVEAHADFFHNF